MLGDNLNDFSRDFYLTDVDTRRPRHTKKTILAENLIFPILPMVIGLEQFLASQNHQPTTKSPNTSLSCNKCLAAVRPQWLLKRLNLHSV